MFGLNLVFSTWRFFLIPFLLLMSCVFSCRESSAKLDIYKGLDVPPTLLSKSNPFLKLTNMKYCKNSRALCLVMYGDNKCKKSIAFKPFFKQLLKVNGARKIYADVRGHYISRYVNPIFFLFFKGYPIDVHAGTFHPKGTMAATFNSRIFTEFISRNTKREENKKFYIWSNHKHKKYFERQSHLNNKNIMMANLNSVNLSSKSIRDTIFSGVDLNNSNFTNSDLSNSIFTHSNMFGANLRGANLHGVFFINTICPNGQNSNTSKFSCTDKNSR